MHVIAGDLISGRASLSWRSDTGAATVRTTDDQVVSLAEVDVLWWRRVNVEQVATEHASDAHEKAIVDNDCRGALAGMLATSFRGTWISSPAATTRASDKIHQLDVAAAMGMRIPRTLVSQSREEVLAFAEGLERIIVKPVVGAAGPLMFTQYGDSLREIAHESFATAPAIYQEFVPGTRHIRLNCFGEFMYAALIETESLDWRPDLNVPMRSWPVPR
jgi:glutathione synthase/RimK-type ligase-like ATP-grasp enzyme